MLTVTCVLIGLALASASKLALPQDWQKDGPFGHIYSGKAFDDYEDVGKAGLGQLEFFCHKVNCDGGGIRGMQITYQDKTTTNHGFTGGHTPKPDPKTAKTFVVSSDAGEYIKSVTLFWNKEHGLGLQLITSTGRSTQIGHQTGQVQHSTAPPRHQLASFFGNEVEAQGHMHISALGWYWVPNCDTIDAVKGYWVPLTYSSGSQQFTFTTGTTSSYTKSTTRTWSHSTTESVTAGFSFAGFSMSTTVSHTASYEIARSYSSTFSQTTTESSSLTFPPGQIWQWHFNVTDVCGNTDVLGHDWVQTENKLAEPCCPPGFAANATQQHGACANTSLSVCK
jgi:hypothetical protein